jgi:hypothetical protein
MQTALFMWKKLYEDGGMTPREERMFEDWMQYIEMLEKSDNRTAIEKANDLFLETVGGKTES